MMQLGRSIAHDDHCAFSRHALEQENPQCVDISLARVPVLVGSIPVKCQNERHSSRGKKPKRQNRFDPLKKNMLNSFHKRFLFKIGPSVLKPAVEGTATEMWCFQGLSWIGSYPQAGCLQGAAGLPWMSLLFFHEIQSTSCSEGPKHAAMTSTVCLFSSHSNIHCQNSGRKDWSELVLEMNIAKLKHRD